MNMKTGTDGLAVMQHWETCKLRAYPDAKSPLAQAIATGRPTAGLSGAPWTCGWGSTGADIGPGTVWTQAEADTRFAKMIVDEFEPLVNSWVTVPLTQRQFDALVSIVSNVGPGKMGANGRDGIIRLKTGVPSTLLRKVNAADYAGASAEFLKWISPGTNVTHGLLRRRTCERGLFDGMSAVAAIAAGMAV